MRLVAAALLVSTGCAMSVRAHGGGIVDSQGLGFQVGVVAGVGLANAKQTLAVTTSAGAVAGGTPELGLGTSADVIVLPAHRERPQLGARAGLGGAVLVYGNPAVVGLHLAPLYLVRDTARRRSRTVHALGAQAMIGMTIDDPLSTTGSPARLAGGLAVTYELISFSDFKILP